MPENEMVEVFRGNDAILYNENRRGRLRGPQRNRHAEPNRVEKVHLGKLEFTLQVAYQKNDIRFDIIKAALQTLFEVQEPDQAVRG